MFVLRVSVDPEGKGEIGDLDLALQTRLEGPLVGLEGIDGIEGIYVAPDGLSAFVSILGADTLDLPAAAVGDSLRDAAVAGLLGAPAHVEVYMAAPSPDACPICKQVGRHDWSKHTASADFAGGLTRL